MSAKKRTSSRLRAAAQERMKVTGEKYTAALAVVTRGENPPIIIAETRYPVEEIVRRRVAPDSGDDMGGAVFDASRAAVEIIDALRDSGLDIPLVMSDVAYEPREWETEKITDAKSAVYDILHRELDRSWADEEGYDTIGHADAAVESLLAGGARFPEINRTAPRPVTLPVFYGEDMVLDMKSHVLVAGATGTGKTVLIERIAQSLLDLGDEVWVSSAYPMRVTPSLLFEADEATEMLREATNIMNGRYERMNEIGASTYAEAGLRGLGVVVNDAFGRGWKRETSDVLSRLTRLGGTAGIRVVVSSQISPNGPVGRHEEDFTHRVLMGRTIQGIAQLDTPESVTARRNRGQGIYRDADGNLREIAVPRP